MTVQLSRPESGLMHLLHHSLRSLVPEDADRQYFRRQALRDVARHLHRDLAYRGSEDETNCVSAQADAEQRVRL